jgi:hypothetical protein
MGPGRAPGTPIRGRSSAVSQNAESAPLGYRSERNAELIGIGFPSPTNTEEQGGADTLGVVDVDRCFHNVYLYASAEWQAKSVGWRRKI